MMFNFATDVDLLKYEPNVFVDLPFTGQRRLILSDGSLAGDQLQSASGGFDVLDEGNVVLISREQTDRNAWGILTVEDDNHLTLAESPVGLSGDTDLTLEVRTFEPQITITHEELMVALGVDVDDPEEALDESAIVSVSLMRRLECLGALSRMYAGAISLLGQNENIEQKAEYYRRLFREALNGARLLVDVNGDGYADEWRTPGIVQLKRI